MGLQQGLNNIYNQGIYVSDANNALFEYKIFHTDSEYPSHIIFTNLRNGKTYGPFILETKLGVLEEAELVLKNFVNKDMPNL